MSQTVLPLFLPDGSPEAGPAGETNQVRHEDRPVHDWYRFVLSFPPHLVRTYLERFDLPPRGQVLDPFCGTGTTVVESKKRSIAAVGVEANPVAHFASEVKTDWSPDPDRLAGEAERVAEIALRALAQDGLTDQPLPDQVNPTNLRSLDDSAAGLLLKNSISPLPLHKVLVLLEVLDRHAAPECRRHQRLALATTLVQDASNLKFGPEVGVGKPKTDAAVIRPWLRRVRSMAADLRSLHGRADTSVVVHRADARSLASFIAPGSIHAVITSPPYPNEKDYSRTTRLESVLLGFTPDKEALRAVKQSFVRSNTRSVYKQDEDDRWISGHPEIERIAAAIEQRRLELGKTSGFERLYPRLTKLYFGGMARHLAGLRPLLAPGARLAYVVGDQASYLQVMIRTGQLLADLAERLGYEVVGIDLFRTRLATATREQLREEVVVLRWPGESG
ncbi:MAG: DNA methyltransferase [Gemmatimonadetes bacterium]|nr:DNA methyltransferase [Gemmatimonadota bacterium]